MTIIQKMNLKNIDKSNWQSFKFQEIAYRISETVDPNTTELDVYIGLEHIDGENIHIKRFGIPADVSGGKLKCYPGDVIFGKRRAYQRKAAIVDFEGICSAHAFVFRANLEVIEPKLFPFFLHSDQFMDRAVDISVGGLSPTINWGDLKDQEFLLPPKEEQAKLAELLWAMNEVIEREKGVFENINKNKEALQNLLFDKDKYSQTKLEKYASILGGYAFSSDSFINEGVPVVKIKNIVEGSISIEEKSNYVDVKIANMANKYLLYSGDILIAMTGATLGKIGVVQNTYDRALLNQRVGKFELKEGVNKFYMYGILDSQHFLRELNKYIGEGAQGNISAEDISKTQVPYLTIEETNHFGGKFHRFSSALKEVKMKLQSSRSLQKSLINQIF